MIEFLGVFLVGAAFGWFSAPNPTITPPPADAMVRCVDLPAPRGPTLADVQRSAVEAAVAYRDVCLDHDQLIDWSDRATSKFK